MRACYVIVVRWLVVLLMLVSCERKQPGASPGGEVRIVSLTPSATEVVAALGASAQLVGVDEFSTYPPEVAALPKVGSFLAPNVERIVALRPTLVIVDDIHGATATVLGDAGITAVACAIHGLPDVKSALRTVGGKLGKSREADAAIAKIEEALDAASAKKPARRPRVLAVIDREPDGVGGLVAAGPGSWLDELLAVVGAQNVLAASAVKYPKISIEDVLRAQPEIILDLSYPARTSVAPWKSVDTPASKSGRVRALSDPYLVAPSPRVIEALAALGRAVEM